MSTILGGVGTSHVPAIGNAVDRGRTDSDKWRPLFDGYEAARRWIADLDPDVVIVVYNDHGNALSLDLVPTFLIGVAAEYEPADEGFGPRAVPTVPGEEELGWHLAESLILDGFDMTICSEMTVDHGLTVPLSVVFGQPESWPARVVPLAVNVVQYPPPTAQRCLDLGRAIRRAVDGHDGDLDVVILGTGGMSHQLQGERAGFINPEFDRSFLDRIGSDPHGLAAMTHTDYIKAAGTEGMELIMWLIMRGALNESVTEIHRHYFAPVSSTAAGLVVLEDA